jgi:site-specific DNA-methyltransferase (adenine-specific)
VDSIVTDPPYELGFMGKKWDNSGIAYSVELWQECLRVLKPGGHLLSFGGTRTWHRVAVAIEDAGFDVRDSIAWLDGSGFPKSLDISKALDKVAGVERQELPTLPMQTKGDVGEISKNRRCSICLKALASGNPCQCDRTSKPITPEAQQWQGWGTALKPALEPIVVARKPLIGTVAENVLTHGTGGLNIDASRIGTEQRINQPAGNKQDSKGVYKFSNDEVDAFNGTEPTTVQGRWPANLILDDYTAELLDEQTEINTSRFFYVAKASKRDRNEGLEELPDKLKLTQMRSANGTGDKNFDGGFTDTIQKNIHPTVKPTQLMRYLVKLVTAPGGTVLDPFTGSGSTGKAAILEGFDFIGIELTEEYLPIIEGRLKHAETMANSKLI